MRRIVEVGLASPLLAAYVPKRKSAPANLSNERRIVKIARLGGARTFCDTFDEKSPLPRSHLSQGELGA